MDSGSLRRGQTSSANRSRQRNQHHHEERNTRARRESILDYEFGYAIAYTH